MVDITITTSLSSANGAVFVEQMHQMLSPHKLTIITKIRPEIIPFHFHPRSWDIMVSTILVAFDTHIRPLGI